MYVLLISNVSKNGLHQTLEHKQLGYSYSELVEFNTDFSEEFFAVNPDSELYSMILDKNGDTVFEYYSYENILAEL